MPTGVYTRKPFTKEHRENIGATCRLRGIGKWMKGKKATPETREKLSITHMGHKAYNVRYGKDNYFHGKRFCGEKNRNWKGGITSIYDAIRNLAEYALWRARVFERDEFICQECGDSGRVNAHHKISFKTLVNDFLHKYSQFSPIEDREILMRLCVELEEGKLWDISNGITLCRECHGRTETYLNPHFKEEAKAKEEQGAQPV